MGQVKVLTSHELRVGSKDDHTLLLRDCLFAQLFLSRGLLRKSSQTLSQTEWNLVEFKLA